VQSQVSGWYTKYQNRLATAFDPDTDRNVYRNLGEVNKAGVDGSVAYQPIENLMLYVFGSYMESEIQDDIESAGAPIPTAGKREAGAPAYTYGGTVRGFLGPVELGVTAKRTGGRYIYDTNEPIMAGGVEVYPAKTNAFWLVNLDARYSLADLGLEKSYLQLNVYNLFDKLYVGNYPTSLSQGTASPPFAQIGAPRTVSGTFVVGF
jgi:iron complex outermembrane receptor protein